MSLCMFLQCSILQCDKSTKITLWQSSKGIQRISNSRLLPDCSLNKNCEESWCFGNLTCSCRFIPPHTTSPMCAICQYRLTLLLFACVFSPTPTCWTTPSCLRYRWMSLWWSGTQRRSSTSLLQQNWVSRTKANHVWRPIHTTLSTVSTYSSLTQVGKCLLSK